MNKYEGAFPYQTKGMKQGAKTSVHRKHGVYRSSYTTSAACVRTTEVTVVFGLGVHAGAVDGCSSAGMRMMLRQKGWLGNSIDQSMTALSFSCFLVGTVNGVQGSDSW